MTGIWIFAECFSLICHSGVQAQHHVLLDQHDLLIDWSTGWMRA